MDETLFYVAGIALILIALGISAIGMRSDDFPSAGVLRAGVAATALVVVITAFGAVTLSQAEQENREAEENEAAALAEEEMAAENEESGAGVPETPEDSGEGPTDGGGQSPDSAGAPPEVVSDAGSATFVENGCGSCHTLTDLGDQALGQIGPNLDEALVDKDPDYIETAIVDPGAVVAEGFSDGIMPADFAEQIAPADLTALVDYLSQATSASGGQATSGSGGASASGSGKK